MFLAVFAGYLLYMGSYSFPYWLILIICWLLSRTEAEANVLRKRNRR